MMPSLSYTGRGKIDPVCFIVNVGIRDVDMHVSPAADMAGFTTIMKTE
jgi:hypothetical protein